MAWFAHGQITITINSGINNSKARAIRQPQFNNCIHLRMHTHLVSHELTPLVVVVIFEISGMCFAAIEANLNDAASIHDEAKMSAPV